MFNSNFLTVRPNPEGRINSKPDGQIFDLGRGGLIFPFELAKGSYGVLCPLTVGA